MGKQVLMSVSLLLMSRTTHRVFHRVVHRAHRYALSYIGAGRLQWGSGWSHSFGGVYTRTSASLNHGGHTRARHIHQGLVSGSVNSSRFEHHCTQSSHHLHDNGTVQPKNGSRKQQTNYSCLSGHCDRLVRHANMDTILSSQSVNSFQISKQSLTFDTNLVTCSKESKPMYIDHSVTAPLPCVSSNTPHKSLLPSSAAFFLPESNKYHRGSNRRSLHTYSHTFHHPIQPAGVTVTRFFHTLQDFTLHNDKYRAYLDSMVAEYDRLAELQLKGESVDHDRFMFLESIAMTVRELRSMSADVLELQTIVSGEEDPELQTLASRDVDSLQHSMEQMQEKLVDLLVGSEPADENDIMLEVSSGIGGQEAMLFTGEMLDMYAGYAHYKGWTFSVVDQERSDLGGVRRASALITGLDVYKHLKLEAGVHRVQRVPRTEKSGRIHTSTMTVAVLPQPSQIDIAVSPKDLHIDTFRAGGAGGQHVNKTESAVRITHKPTGTVAECQQDRSQIKNREMAMKILLSRLYQRQIEEQEDALRKKRKLQVGSAGRSEKIRTYNYSQDRITDHRGPITFFGVTLFLSGEEDLESLLQTLMQQSRLEILQAMVEESGDTSQ